MTGRLWTCWIIATVCSVALLIPSVMRYRAAVKTFEDAHASRGTNSRLQADIDTIVRSLPAWVHAPEVSVQEGALAQRFTTALTSAGLAPADIEAFTPASSTLIEVVPGSKTGPQIARSRASASLTGVTLPKLGRLLEAWRLAAPAWTVTQIDSTPLRLSPIDAASCAGSDLPLRVSLTVERLTATGLQARIPHTDAVPAKGPKDASR